MAEVIGLVAVGDDLTRVAMAVMAVQAVCAGVVLFLALGRPAGAHAVPGSAVAEPTT